VPFIFTETNSDIKGKGKVHPITGHKGLEVDRGIAYTFLNLSTECG